MKLVDVTLQTPDPDAMRAFYGDRLGLPVVSTDPLTVAVGESTLTFDHGPGGTHHFAFTADAPVESVRSWLADRVDLHRHEGDPVVTFPFIDADVVYFDDPAGNVVEYISYTGHAGAGFTPDALQHITEIGLPVDDVPTTATAIEAALDVPIWGGIDCGLTDVGDREGRLLVSEPGRHWFPTDSPSVIGPTTITADVPRTYRHPVHPYTIRRPA